MHKKILAAAVAFAVATPAMALTVLEDDNNKLTIGGRVGYKTHTEDGDTSGKNDSARINFAFESKLTESLTGIGKAEWGFKAQNEYTSPNGEKTSTSDLFSNRLGFVGLQHEELGTIKIGKEWSPYSQVANWTDVYAIGGGKAMGMYEGYTGDGGVNGTGRADDAISYAISTHGLNIGLQYQLKDSAGSDFSGGQLVNSRAWSRKRGSQMAMSYDFDFGVSLGYTYNQTQFEQRSNAVAHVVAARYEMDQVYLAATFGKFENHTNAVEGAGYAGDFFDKKSTGIELYGRYDLQAVDGLGLYAGYNQLKVDEHGDGTTDSRGKLDHKTLGAVYNIGPMQFAGEYTFNDSKDHAGNKDKDNYFNLQFRYYF